MATGVQKLARSDGWRVETFSQPGCNWRLRNLTGSTAGADGL